MTCTHLLDAAPCGAAPTRRYLTGLRCAEHTPAALAGAAETVPDPARTLSATRAAAGLPDVAPPDAASGLVDERAVASGKRRSNAGTYRAARAAEDARKSR